MGFHVYKDIWTPVLNEVNPIQQEHCNPEDRYAVSILKDDVVVGHKGAILNLLALVDKDRGLRCYIVTTQVRNTLYSYTLSEGMNLKEANSKQVLKITMTFIIKKLNNSLNHV